MNFKNLLLIIFILNIHCLFAVQKNEGLCENESEVQYTVFIPGIFLNFKLKPSDSVSKLFELMIQKFEAMKGGKKGIVKIEEINLYDDAEFKAFTKVLKYPQSNNIKMKDLTPIIRDYNPPYFEVLIN